MDIVEILFLLLFLVLPLLQGILEQGRKRRNPPPPPLPPEEDLPTHAPGERERSALETMRLPPFPGEAHRGLPPGWPVEWEGWEAEEELEAAAEPAAPEGVATREAEVAEYVPEEVRVASPVVSLEPLYVNHGTEHRRFHERYVAPPVAPRPRPVSPAARLARHLSGDELRRAVLLSEVLGPPVSMRE